jgi:hypothetical protein
MRVDQRLVRERFSACPPLNAVLDNLLDSFRSFVDASPSALVLFGHA